MGPRSFAIVPTALGPVGLVWSGAGLAGVALPDRDEAGTRRRLARRWPDAVESPPSPAIAALATRIERLLAGERVPLDGTPLDIADVPDFDRSVYAVALTIPPGETLTYGAVASRLGDKQLAQAVGAALGRNPIPIVVPCHRVLAAGGRSGGFSAPGGAETKLKLLAIEGAAPGGQPDLFATAGR